MSARAGHSPPAPSSRLNPLAGGALEVYISVTNNVPYLSWKPDLGPASRKYTVYGTETLSPPNWQPVEDMGSTSARFFKVTIGP